MTWNDSLYWRDREMPEPSLEPPYEPEEEYEEQEGEEDMFTLEINPKLFAAQITDEDRVKLLLALVTTCKDCIYYENYCKGYGKEGYCSEAVRKTPAEPETPEKGRKVC